MIKNKKNVKKAINIKFLEEAKLGINTINSLSGNIGSSSLKTMSDTPELHAAVQKMQNRNSNKNDTNKIDNRNKHIEKIRNKSEVINEKFSILEQRKKGYINKKKLDYELELEKKRIASKKGTNKTIFQFEDFEKLNKQAANLFSEDLVKKLKVKNSKENIKDTNQNYTELKSLFDTSNSNKISFKTNSVTNNKRISNILEEIPVLKEENYFAKDLYESENKRVFTSPLDSYKVKEEEESEKGETNEFNIESNQEKLDLKTIDQKAKKFLQDAEKIRKEIEKNNEKLSNTDDISSIYSRILNSSKNAKLSRTKKQNSQISNSVDISKMPSIAFEKK
ncbi:hypothetical protein [Spiroplasma diminutum]|uniref:Uncharacterized protein n=1 Tax=Spiroplasma diminutum CUAS-1 TaxID=1276221 RepID=S5ME62_9MOLU|nr:hypothetical protein [Spiroplasma diminutum]AGR42013.1 hypothetical protein SDIMI_v3c03090 [Spiroplasma diminutum CUAS-1]